MSELRYNFVFFFARYDFWRSLLGKELYDSKHVRIYREAFQGSKFLQKIFHYHWACSVNQKICLPLKRIWFKKMYNQGFEDDLPIVFVYLAGGTIYYGKDYLEYVKEKNPKNKNVMYYADLLQKGGEREHYLLKDLVDLEVTYDAGEAKKYGIHLYQGDTYSKAVEEVDSSEIKYDAYFIGSAKDRLDKILRVCGKLTDAGLKCKFLIAGVPESKQKEQEGVEYITAISYEENLQNVVRSKCILEFIQGGSDSSTMRCSEAIAYRKRFLTDCQLDFGHAFNPGQLQQYNDPDDIDIFFLKKEFDPDEYTPQKVNNPFDRLYDIQDALDNCN